MARIRPVPRPLRFPPTLDPASRPGRVAPRTALLINPFYPKDPHASFGKHVLTPTLALTSFEVKQETTYSDYKNMDGVKKATKVESKRDGQKYMTLTVGSFKVLDKVDPKTFTEPD
jgi:hypothetical protein